MPAFEDVLSVREAAALIAMIADLGRVIESEEEDGASIFRARCVSCHGPRGKGDGPLARELIPRPRDLTRAWYRFRSTPSGEGPLHGDLVTSLERGLGVTAMGGFSGLGHERVDRVAAFVGTLTASTPDRDPLARAAPPDGGEAELARGQVLYDDARCWQCHGAEARGDGPSSRELRDDGGRASLPANLRRPWRLKGGADVESLVRTIANGLNGTPMPSYGDVLTTDELWALARYIRSLAESRPEVPRTVPTQRSAKAFPRDPAAPFWGGLVPTRMPLGPQAFVAPRWHRPAIDVADVIIGWSAEEIVFHLAWDDPFEDRGSEDIAILAESINDPALPGRWRLPDQLALRLTRVPADGALPPLVGADHSRGHVEWRWSADEEAPRGEGLDASATFDEGRWQLVLVGSRRDPEIRRLLYPGARVALSLQLWEGSQGESGTRHAVSSWIPFTLPGE